MRIQLLTVFVLAILAHASPRQDLDGLIDKLVMALPAGKPVVAVMPLEGDAQDGQAIAEYVVASLSGSGRATVVERTQFQQAIHELSLAQTGVMSEEQGLQVGKALSARYLIVGSIGTMMGQKRVNLRLLETETAQVLSGGSFAADDLAQLSRELFGEAGNMSASLYRSAVGPGWGQFYTGHPVRGSIALVAFLGAAGFMGYSFLQQSELQGDVDDLKNQRVSNSGQAMLETKFQLATGLDAAGNMQAFNDWYGAELATAKSNRDDAGSQAMLGLGITLGVYALNLVDAAFCGAAQKRKVDLYFSAIPALQGGVDGTMKVAYQW